MDERRTGDLVWIRHKLVPRPADDLFAPDDAVYIMQIDGTVMCGPPESAIPDHPALPAISRWLRETPDAVTLLTAAITAGRYHGAIWSKAKHLGEFIPPEDEAQHVAFKPSSGDLHREFDLLVAEG